MTQPFPGLQKPLFKLMVEINLFLWRIFFPEFGAALFPLPESQPEEPRIMLTGSGFIVDVFPEAISAGISSIACRAGDFKLHGSGNRIDFPDNHADHFCPVLLIERFGCPRYE
ncbi:MAG: hypothetical protein BWY42_01183 [Candidatus Omnitrophica bacterium ADurb.Bin277]|nr:MAG: hypothetical protein BWY42_01183 [Candidatus Omnitrophica bacterium ADurb.Bin277]